MNRCGFYLDLDNRCTYEGLRFMGGDLYLCIKHDLTDEGRQPPPFVYVILAEEVRRIKVGISTSPKARLAGMQTGSPCTLKLLAVARGSLYDERNLHKKLTQFHAHGEWFDLTDECLGMIEAYMSKMKGRKVFNRRDL